MHESEIQRSLGQLEANVTTIMEVQKEIKSDMEKRLRALEADRNKLYGIAAIAGAASGFVIDIFRHKP